MKASLKFREDRKPLFKAKIPLNILGFPFQSGVATGDTKELSLNLSTFFESGPSIKLTYRPNDSWNPFSLVVKTGIGSFGSPISAPMLMSAEFNLMNRGNPSFFVHFRPQIGDFRIKKSVESPASIQPEKPPPVVFTPPVTRSYSKDASSDADEPVVDGNGEAALDNGVFSERKINGILKEKSAVNGLVNGVQVTARTVFPVRSRAVVGFRWGVRFPAGFQNPFEYKKWVRNPTAVIPFLVMDKISIEHVAEERLKKEEEAKRGPLEVDADVARVCLAVKRELEVLQNESDSLRRAVEGLRSEIGAGKFREVGIAGGNKLGGKNGRDRDGNGTGTGKVMEGDVGEELKKALMGSAGAGM